jgi:hypothetical protein
MMGQRTAYAYTEPDKTFTAMSQKTLDSIVSPGTATGPDTQPAYGQIHIVIYDIYIGFIQFVPTHERAYSSPAVIHIRLRFDQQYLFTVIHRLGYQGIHLTPPDRNAKA